VTAGWLLPSEVYVSTPPAGQAVGSAGTAGHAEPRITRVTPRRR
jgi:hypothetical protein